MPYMTGWGEGGGSRQVGSGGGEVVDGVTEGGLPGGGLPGGSVGVDEAAEGLEDASDDGRTHRPPVDAGEVDKGLGMCFRVEGEGGRVGRLLQSVMLVVGGG